MQGAADYAFILGISGKMLAAALEGRWEDVIDLEKEYSSAVFAAESSKAQPELVTAILDNDAKIKSLAKARIEDLKGAGASAGQAIKLNEAYRP